MTVQISCKKRLFAILQEKADIKKRLAELDAEEWSVVAKITGTKVQHKRWHFYADCKHQIVRWNTGEVSLQDTGFAIVNALINARKRRLKTDDLCLKVWGGGITKQETLRKALHRLNAALKDAPFRIKPIKGRNHREIIENNLCPVMGQSMSHSTENLFIIIPAITSVRNKNSENL